MIYRCVGVPELVVVCYAGVWWVFTLPPLALLLYGLSGEIAYQVQRWRWQRKKHE